MKRRLITVGSEGPCTLRIPQSDVSAAHLALYWDDARLWAVDLLSRLGTRRDGRRVLCVAVPPGEGLQLGKVRLDFLTPRDDFSSQSDTRPSLPSAVPGKVNVVAEEERLCALREAVDGQQAGLQQQRDELELARAQQQRREDELELARAQQQRREVEFAAELASLREQAHEQLQAAQDALREVEQDRSALRAEREAWAAEQQAREFQQAQQAEKVAEELVARQARISAEEERLRALREAVDRQQAGLQQQRDEVELVRAQQQRREVEFAAELESLREQAHEQIQAAQNALREVEQDRGVLRAEREAWAAEQQTRETRQAQPTELTAVADPRHVETLAPPPAAMPAMMSGATPLGTPDLPDQDVAYYEVLNRLAGMRAADTWWARLKESFGSRLFKTQDPWQDDSVEAEEHTPGGGNSDALGKP